MIYKLLYYWFGIQTRIQRHINKNAYLLVCISFGNMLYNCIKGVVYQIPGEPDSKKWCNTIAIYRPYYKIGESLNPVHRLFSNIIGFFRGGQPVTKWVVFENLVEFDEAVNITVNAPDEGKYSCSLSIVETTEAKKTVEIVKKKYSHLTDPCLKYNLFILKNNDYYFTKIIYQSNTRSLLFPKKGGVISNIKFMAVEYVHPSLKTPLLVDLSQFKFAVNSHILGFSFVYWYLRSKYGNWTDSIFDMNYKLNIIDGGVHFFEISSFEFITLEENNYSVKSIFSLITG